MSLLNRLRGRSTPDAPPKIVAAAASYFPIAFMTYAYQELLGLRDIMGTEVRILFWHQGDAAILHDAYRPLLALGVKLEPDVARHRDDVEHFRSTQSTRLASLLYRLSTETARAVDDVERDPHFLQACTFAREVELQGADYLHSYFFYEQSFFTMVAAWLLDIPYGVTAYADHMMRDYHLKLVPLHVELASIIVATSRGVRSELLRQAGEQHAKKILVKPNSVDGRRFTYSDRPPIEGELQLLTVCRIEEKKGLLTLARAARLLADRGSMVRFHLIGTEDVGCPTSVAYGQRFRNLIVELDVHGMFELWGFMTHEEMEPLFRRCHAYAAPYVNPPNGDRDAIPAPMLEAMACGMPVLATNAGSLEEVVRSGCEGFVCPQDDPDALVEIIERMINQPDQITMLGRQARERIEAEFDSQVAEPKLHERILSVVAARR